MLRYITALIVVFLFNAFQSAFAYEFAPIVAELAPKGPGSVKTFVARNTNPEAVALQIEVFHRTADENGEEVREAEYEDFIVSPPQMVLAPGQSQAVRVRWIGTPDIDAEQSYRIIVKQLPINYKKLNEGETSVTLSVGYEYQAAVYVVPPKAKPSAVIKDAVEAEGPNGEKLLRLTIQSTGTTRAILEDPRVSISAANGKTITLQDEQVEPLRMKNIITGSQSVIDLPWPTELASGPLKAELNTTYFSN
jgi:fimbrial chaperone protein